MSRFVDGCWSYFLTVANWSTQVIKKDRELKLIQTVPHDPVKHVKVKVTRMRHTMFF